MIAVALIVAAAIIGLLFWVDRSYLRPYCAAPVVLDDDAQLSRFYECQRRRRSLLR